MYPASHSYFMSIDKPTVVVKRFFGNSLSELCLRHFQSFLVAFNERVQNIEKSKASFVEFCIVFRHCEGKDSTGTSRCTYQPKVNQHYESSSTERRQGS